MRFLIVIAFCFVPYSGPAGETGSALPTGDVQKVVLSKIDPRFVKNGRLDVESVVRYFDHLYRSDNSISIAELTVIKPRLSRKLRMKIWSSGDEKALVLIESPAREKGTATLKVDKSLWNFFPRIKRTIRIPPSMMLQSWMGSDFTNDDLVQESSLVRDYSYEFTGCSTDPAGWILQFTARPDVVGLWKRFVVVLSEDGLIPLKAMYYDRKDRLSRTITWDSITVFNGRKIPARMTLVPEDKEGQKTEMTYLEINFNAEVPESTFSLLQLENVQ